MCLICVDFKRGAMSLDEARRNYGETVLDKDITLDHAFEIVEMLAEAGKNESKDKSK